MLHKITFFLLLLWGVATQGRAQIPASLLHDLQGRVVRADTLTNGGRPFVVTFFATWCPPCMKELTAMRTLYADWQRQTGVEIFAVCEDQDITIGEVKAFAETRQLPYHFLLDTGNIWAQRLGIEGIPRLFVYDGKGHCVYTHTGYQAGDEQALYRLLLSLKG